MTKTILITGSTDGVGKLTAIQLAEAGHRVYLHGRNADKLKRVKAEIPSVAGGFVADLSDINAVRQLATEIRAQVPQLDVLINNAGVFNTPQVTNADGLDLRMVVNYLAPYVLTSALADFLAQSDDPLVINLSSAAQSPVSLSVLQGTQQIAAQQAYAQSKLALTMWTFQWAADHPEVPMVAVNPGSLLNTRMVKEAFGRHWSEADKGADILVRLAVKEVPAKINGTYFDNDQGHFGRAHADAYNAAARAELLRLTDNILAKL